VQCKNGARAFLNQNVQVIDDICDSNDALNNQSYFKGQINQNFDIFSFNPIYLLCVDLVSNKHILKFQVN